MTDRRHLARLAAEDIEHAYAIFAGGDLREGADADEILEIANALLVHRASSRIRDATLEGFPWFYGAAPRPLSPPTFRAHRLSSSR
jgi:hypothetical protein